jgi:anti-sigma B factor antagonist
MEIQFSENREAKILAAKISGDCDLYSAHDFFTGISAKMTGYQSVYIDFSRVIYLDSSGVGAIIRIIKAAREHNIRLKFRGIRGNPRRVLEMSNILTIITEDK